MSLKESLKKFSDTAKAAVEAEAALIKMQHGEGAECLFRAMVSGVGDMGMLHMIVQEVPQRTANAVLELVRNIISGMLDHVSDAAKCDEATCKMLNDRAVAVIEKMQRIQETAVEEIVKGLHNG